MLKSQPIPEIPTETIRVVHAVFPKGNLYTWLRDNLATIYQDEICADLYPGRGQPTYARLSSGAGDCFPIPGESDRSASCRCRAQPSGLEICASAWS
jgi:hypothetical protein